MKGMKIKEKERSAIVMCIQGTSDILPKGKDILNSYILPNRNDMRSIADITELGEIPKLVLRHEGCQAPPYVSKELGWGRLAGRKRTKL